MVPLSLTCTHTGVLSWNEGAGSFFIQFILLGLQLEKCRGCV